MSANLELLQRKVAHKLLSEELLALVNIVTLRDIQGKVTDTPTKMVQSELVWLTARTGQTKRGAGIIVGMPSKDYTVPNVPGPERKIFVPVCIFEHPVLNQNATTGTLLTAETISDYVDVALAQFQFESLQCVIYPDSERPNADTPGVVRYDKLLVAELPRAQVSRCAMPGISHAAGLVTLTNNESGGTLYYTTDGSFPGSGNSAASVYSTPFAASAGTEICAAAYKSGKIGSDELHATIT